MLNKTKKAILALVIRPRVVSPDPSIVLRDRVGAHLAGLCHKNPDINTVWQILAADNPTVK